jgi:hypothetical protein
MIAVWVELNAVTGNQRDIAIADFKFQWMARDSVRIMLTFETSVQQLMNLAVFDHHVLAKHRYAIARGIADFQVSNGHVIRGNLDSIASLPFAIDQNIFVEARPSNLESFDLLGILQAARLRVGADIICGKAEVGRR